MARPTFAMIAACAIAVLSVLFGAAVGFSRRIGDRHLGPVRTFAFAAALAVVFGQFLPDAFEGIGAWAAVPFALGVLGPWLLEQLTSRVSRSRRALGLEVGYLGLLVHQLGDGVGMGTYTGPRHAGHSHTDVFLAIGGHTVPVAAMVVVAFLRAKGPKVAAVRALGLAIAVVSGVVAARLLSVSLVEAHHAAISGLVGGLLLHIATHDLRANLPTGLRERVLDLAAGAVGLAMVLGTSSGHEHEHASDAVATAARPEALSAFVPLALVVAPPLLLGLVASSILQAIGQRVMAARANGAPEASSGSRLRDALRGALVGLPLPICSCGTLPLAQSLVARGATPALVGAFLVATPSLGVDTLLVTGTFFGYRTAGLRLLLTLGVAVVAALMLSVVARAGAPAPGAKTALFASRDDDAAPLASRAAKSLDELVHHTLPWTVVGLVVASYADGALGRGALALGGRGGLDVVVVLSLALPGYVCATSATPLAAVLLAHGLSPQAVLVGLVVGPALNVATVAWLSRTWGRRAAVVVTSTVAAVAVLGAFASASVGLPSLVRPPTWPRGELGSLVAVALLVVLAAGASFRRGVRGFFASLLDPIDPESGERHDHAGVHDHDPSCAHEPHEHGLPGASSDVELSAHGH